MYLDRWQYIVQYYNTKIDDNLLGAKIVVQIPVNSATSSLWTWYEDKYINQLHLPNPKKDAEADGCKPSGANLSITLPQILFEDVNKSQVNTHVV